METNIADSEIKGKTKTQQIGDWWKAHFIEIAILTIVFLTILSIFGLWRLWKITPQKEPIKIESL